MMWRSALSLIRIDVHLPCFAQHPNHFKQGTPQEAHLGEQSEREVLLPLQARKEGRHSKGSPNDGVHHHRQSDPRCRLAGRRKASPALHLRTFSFFPFIPVCHLSLRKQRADRVGSQLGAHSTQDRSASRAQGLVLQQLARSPTEERFPARTGPIREEAAGIRAFAVYQHNPQRLEARASRMASSRLPRSTAMAAGTRSIHADDGRVEHDGVHILEEWREGS